MTDPELQLTCEKVAFYVQDALMERAMELLREVALAGKMEGYNLCCEDTRKAMRGEKVFPEQ